MLKETPASGKGQRGVTFSVLTRHSGGLSVYVHLHTGTDD